LSCHVATTAWCLSLDRSWSCKHACHCSCLCSCIGQCACMPAVVYVFGWFVCISMDLGACYAPDGYSRWLFRPRVGDSMQYWTMICTQSSQRFKFRDCACAMRFAQCALKTRFVDNKIYHIWKAGDAIRKCKHTICVFEILPAAKGDAFSLQ
jgi:hypothetical protein